MEDDALVRAGALAEDLQRVLVGVAVVDLEGQVGALRHLDMCAEGLLLCLAAGFGRAEVVQAALPHRDDHRVAEALLDLNQRLNEGHVVVAHRGDQPVGRGFGAARVQGRVVGVDRDRDAHAVVGTRQLDHWVEVGQLAGARNHAGDAHLARTFQLLLEAERHALTPGNLTDVGGQVRVVVHHGRRQGRGRVGPGTRLTRAHARTVTFRGNEARGRGGRQRASTTPRETSSAASSPRSWRTSSTPSSRAVPAPRLVVMNSSATTGFS